MKDTRDENDAIDETVTIIAAAIRKHVERAQERAETELKATTAQHREALSQLVEVQAQLKRSRQEVAALVAERLELQEKLKDATTAQALAETQYQRLVAASQQLTEGLTRTLHEQREQGPPTIAASPKRTASVTSSKSAAPPTPAPNLPSAKKKPLQFPGPARDAKRVSIRQGTHVSVDGIPGELVDLSLGGAQAVLQQMVKPNQLVRLTVPTSAGQLTCRGRIVWVVFEQPGTSLSVYRMGVKFTDADTKAVEDFMRDFSEESPGRRPAEIA